MRKIATITDSDLYSHADMIEAGTHPHVKTAQEIINFANAIAKEFNAIAYNKGKYKVTKTVTHLALSYFWDRASSKYRELGGTEVFPPIPGNPDSSLF